MLKSSKTNIGSMFLFILWVVLGTIFSGVLFQLSNWQIFKFIVAQIFFILLPGAVLVCELWREKISKTCFWCFAYSLGYAINIIEYFVFYGLNLEKYMRKGLFVLTVLLLVYFIIRIPRYYLNFDEVHYISVEWIILTLLLVVSVLAYSAKNLSPDLAINGVYSRDNMYWCNNSVSLFLNFPPEVGFFDGVRLFYHYFSSIHVAFLRVITGIDIFTLSFPLYSVGKAIIFCGGIFFFAESMDFPWKLKLLIFLLPFTTGFERFAVVTYTEHAIVGSFGFDIGFAFGMYFFAMFYRQWKKNIFEIRQFIPTILFWFVCSGAKGPIASVLILIPGVICIYWLFTGRYKMAFGYGISILGIFMLINVFCNGLGGILTDASSIFSLGFYSIDDLVRYESIPLLLSLPISIFLQIMGSHPFLMGMMVVFTVMTINKMLKNIAHISKEIWNIACMVSVWSGVALSLMINAGGKSEMYFIMSTLIPAFYTGIYVLEKIQMKPRYRIAEALSIAVLGFCCYCFWFSSFQDTGIIQAMILGIRNLEQAYCGEIQPEHLVESVQKTDLEALRWIKDYAPRDSIVVSDRGVAGHSISFYSYCVFCERQMYMEGTDMFKGSYEYYGDEIDRREYLISNIFYNDRNSLRQVIDEGADYIVQTKWLTPGFIPDETLLEKVYESESTAVYATR